MDATTLGHKYFIENFRGKARFGPVSKEQIFKLAYTGDLTPEDKIYDGEQDVLFPAGKIKGIKFSDPFTEQKPFIDSDQLKAKAQEGFVLLDRHFNHMLSPKLISWGYAVGFVLFAVLGAIAIVHAVWDSGLKSALLYLLFWVFGLVGIRVGAEFTILFFRANEYLKQIATRIDEVTTGDED